MKEQTIKTTEDGSIYCDENYAVFEVDYRGTKEVVVEVSGTILVEVRGTKHEVQSVREDQTVLTEMMKNQHNIRKRKLCTIDADMERVAGNYGFDVGDNEVAYEDTEIQELHFEELTTHEPVNPEYAEYYVETYDIAGDDDSLHGDEILQKVQLYTKPIKTRKESCSPKEEEEWQTIGHEMSYTSH